MKRIFATLTAVVLLSGCYKAKFNATNHPNEAELILEIAAPTLPDNSLFDGTMTLVLDGESYTIEPGEAFALPKLLDPGEYTYYIYSNHTEDDEVSVSYDAKASTIIATVPTVDASGNIDPNPNEIYFGTETILVSADTIVTLDADVATVGRDLNFSLELDGDSIDQLESISATLNGVAQQWDCINNTPYGTSASVIPTLTKELKMVSVASRATDSYCLEGTIHLLGVSDDASQILTIDLSYSGSNPAEHQFVEDISDLLSTFNDDKSTAMTLSNTVETPTIAHPSGSIGDWTLTTHSTELEAK